MNFARTALTTLLLTLAVMHPAAAADYPEKPVKVLVGFPAGQTTDVIARKLAQQLSTSLKQSFYVENKPGVGAGLAAEEVARAKPDGYTLLIGSMSTHAMNPALMPNMPFKGVDDFTPLGLLAYVTNTMVVNASVPVHNVKELIAYAKANPGKVAYASAGPGSTNHLSAVLFEKMAGVQLLHVPYKGGAPAVVDTVAGQTQLLFSAGTQTLTHVKSGKLRLLAVTEAKRSPLLPNVPTVGETLPGYELSVWYGAFGPKNMPAELVTRLNNEINRAMALPDVKAKMESIGVETATSTPQEFGKILRRDADRYGKLIRELGIQGE